METYHVGYLAHQTDYRITEKNKLSVLADHIFDKEEYVEAYSKDGEYYGRLLRSKRHTIRKWHEVDKQKKVCQINFDFELLPVGRGMTLEELSETEDIFRKALKKNMKECHTKIHYEYHFNSLNEQEMKTPREASVIGCSRCLTLQSRRGFINFNYQQYKKNLERFKENNDNLYHQDADRLFDINIKRVAAFYCTTEHNIKRKDFDKSKYIIDRLNSNINRKIR